MDWSGWMQATDEGREAMRRRYREEIVERDENNARWSRMTPLERARYPEASPSPKAVQK
jgi:hypothetical protein